MKLKYIVEKEMLVKEYLEYVGISRHLRKKVRLLDNIYVNGIKSKNYYQLKINDILELEFTEKMNNEYPISKEKLDIIYEDEYLLIINKPINISSQPSRTHLKDNILSMAKNYFIENNINGNIHLINRLDYQTSGLLIIGKNNIIHYEMTKINILKKYICEIEGKMDCKEGTIIKSISRYPSPDIRRYVDEKGQEAITKYKVLEEKDNTSIIEVELVTGRCHQIRVHFSYLNHPIIGDRLYGNGKEGSILHLHSYFLKFNHPILKKDIIITNYPEWGKNVYDLNTN